MITRCLAEFPPDEITAEDFNDEKLRHTEFSSSVYSGKIKLVCKKCGDRCDFTNHYDFSKTHPQRQAVCRGCGASVYLLA